MLHYKEYKSLIISDEILWATTRKTRYPLQYKAKHSVEMKVIRMFRFVQVNKDNIVGKFLSRTVLHRYGIKYGVSLSRGNTIGKGFLIGHFGRIIINGNAIIGDDFVVSNGVVIGMDMRGGRKGVPTIGNRVCIHANSVIVGNIKVGNDVVIAPDAFVNFDVPDHSIVIGNPATIHHRDNATEEFIGYHTLDR